MTGMDAAKCNYRATGILEKKKKNKGKKTMMQVLQARRVSANSFVTINQHTIACFSYILQNNVRRM